MKTTVIHGFGPPEVLRREKVPQSRSPSGFWVSLAVIVAAAYAVLATGGATLASEPPPVGLPDASRTGDRERDGTRPSSGKQRGSPPQIGTSVKQMYPDFFLPKLDGGYGRLSDFRGKKVLLIHFASW